MCLFGYDYAVAATLAARLPVRAERTFPKVPLDILPRLVRLSPLPMIVVFF
jgi:hypothetical protein